MNTKNIVIILATMALAGAAYFAVQHYKNRKHSDNVEIQSSSKLLPGKTSGQK